MTARFVRVHNGNVVLMRPGGRIVTLPFHNLSAADQEYARELLASRGEEDTIPPPPEEPDNDGLGGMPGGVTGMPGGGGAAMPEDAAAGMPGGGFGGPVQMPFSTEPRFPSRMGGGMPTRMPQHSIRSSADAGSGTMPGTGASPLDGMRQQHEDMLQRMAADREQSNQQWLDAQRSAADARDRAFADSQRQLREQRERLRQNEIIGECLACKGRLTKAQSDGTTCPHCGVTWDYEIDEFGQKKQLNNASSPFSSSSSTGSPRVPLDPQVQARIVKIALAVIVIVGVIVLAAITIFIATVIASTGARKPQRYG